ncbi:unnamed protein product, partial [Iphiclides podalirius]
MVLTRSRAASPASAAAGVSPEGVVPPLFPAESAPESTPRDLEAAPAPPPAVSSDSDAVIADQGHAPAAAASCKSCCGFNHHDHRAAAAVDKQAKSRAVPNFARILHEVKHRVEDQQDIRKAVGDQHRRDIITYKKGDLVLVETHMASNAAKGITSKFAPRREGPYQVSQ